VFRSLGNLHNIIGLRHPSSLSFAGRNIPDVSASRRSFDGADHTMHSLLETRGAAWRASIIVGGVKASFLLVQLFNPK
jgi:hypothetical protein